MGQHFVTPMRKQAGSAPLQYLQACLVPGIWVSFYQPPNYVNYNTHHGNQVPANIKTFVDSPKNPKTALS